MAAVLQPGARTSSLLKPAHGNCNHAFRSIVSGPNRHAGPRQSPSGSSSSSGQYARGFRVRSASSGAFESPDSADAEPIERDYTPFTRIRERDPYRRLGLRRDASFEEVIDAKNFLYDQYKWHEASKESIELAFDTVIQDKLKARNKYGFRPPRTGRRTDVIGDPIPKSPLEKFLGLFDPSVTINTITTEGVIYAALAAWAFLTRDVSLPLASTFLYAVYRTYTKRVLINPEGPYFGGTAVFGAVFAGAAALVVGGLTGTAVVKGLAMTTQITPFMILIVQAVTTILTTGLLNISLR